MEPARPCCASTRTMRPFSNVSAKPRTTLPSSTSGSEPTARPFTPSRLGAVNSSSVGMFGTNTSPSAVRSAPPAKKCPSGSATVSSVPSAL